MNKEIWKLSKPLVFAYTAPNPKTVLCNKPINNAPTNPNGDRLYSSEKVNLFGFSKLGGFDLYSSSKAACDIIAESYIKSFFSNSSCGIAIVRSGNCIGGGDWTKDRIVKDCAESFSRNKKLVIRSPNATRP